MTRPRLELVRPEDAFFLHAETPRVQQHVAGVALLDPSTAPNGILGLDDVREAVCAALPSLPRLRQKLLIPALGLARPVWVDDPEFCLADHVRTTRITSPGGKVELIELTQTLISSPLDRSKPPWELVLIEGLEGGQSALLMKLHHVLADGIGALRIVGKMFSRTPDPSLHRATGWSPRSLPSPPGLFWGSLVEQVRAPVLAGRRGARRAMEEPADFGRRTRNTARGIWELARNGPARRSPLNGEMSGRLRVALFEVPRSAIRDAKRRRGAYAHEIVLAAVAEGLHRMFQGRVRLPRDPRLRAIFPITADGRGGPEHLGNWTSALQVELPVGPMAPESRLAAIHKTMSFVRSSHQAEAARLVMSATGMLLPSPLHGAAVRRMYRGRWFNLIVSDIQGSIHPLYLAGAKVITAYPIIPLADRVGLGVAAMCWCESITFGIAADEHAVPHIDVLAQGIQQAVAELHRE